MKQLVEYVTQFDPSYPATIRGASPTEINELESLSPRGLPASYREFLSYLGHEMGRLQLPDVSFDISHPLRVYTHKRWPTPPRYLFFGLYQSDPDLDFYFDLDATAPEPSIVRFPRLGPNNEYFRYAYDSLQELMFSLAFRRIRMPLLPASIEYGPGDWPVDAPKGAAMKRLGELALNLGFQKLPQVGDTAPCYERGNAAMTGYEPDELGFFIQIAADSQNEVKRLGAILEDTMGIRPE